jgi:hypothetical protein
MTPTRLRQIAKQLEAACSAYQEKIMKSGYQPCRTCSEMAQELREFAKEEKPCWSGPVLQPPRTSNHEPAVTGDAN